LIEIVRERLGQSGTRHLVDVYCVVGFFGLELADQVDSFIGIELDRLAIQAARRNAVVRGCVNGEFVAGSAEDLLPGMLAKFIGKNTTILLDPPRKGCGLKTLELLRAIKPAQIIYVSCHPATMARDLNILCKEGVFHLVRVLPLDMFPQTSHVESVADLRCIFSGPAIQTSASN
jgi:23S rRNA (uracil1939-C5)-methyltransferase